MNEATYADLPELAGHLRAMLAEKAERQPAKSPFILLYAFNGTGKTRLSAAFKDLGKEDEWALRRLSLGLLREHRSQVSREFGKIGIGGLVHGSSVL